MLPKEIREQIVLDRLAGASIKDLAEKFGHSKGTIHFIVRDIDLKQDQIDILMARKATGARLCNASRSEEQRLHDSTKGGKACQKKHGVRLHKNLLNGNAVAGLVYRNDELDTLRQVSRYFGCEFAKEQIGKRFIDFANSQMLVEHTRDCTKGVQDLTRRYAEVAALGDTRLRFGIVPLSKIGKLRRSRLEALSVTLLDISVLQSVA